MSESFDELLVERARFSPVAWAVQTEQDRKNLCEFVKSICLDCIYDGELQNKLTESLLHSEEE